eukprot:13209483-Heterocapsa_arctica.AAC.1
MLWEANTASFMKGMLRNCRASRRLSSSCIITQKTPQTTGFLQPPQDRNASRTLCCFQCSPKEPWSFEN